MWGGLGNPCDDMDYDLFYAFTTMTDDNGAHTPFWDTPWVQDRKPKDIAPSSMKDPHERIGRIGKP